MIMIQNLQHNKILNLKVSFIILQFLKNGLK
jgi:hypothetical protein